MTIDKKKRRNINKQNCFGSMLQPSQLSESEESILCNISIAFRQASFLAASSEDCGVPIT